MWMSALQVMVTGMLLAGAPAGSTWAPPLAAGWGEVLQAFERPTDRFAPGHRGVDLAARSGTPVQAIGGGEVTYVGEIAGVPSVTIDHHLVRSTYLPVAASVRVGQQVSLGQVIGSLNPTGHCSGPCLHLGVRRPAWEALDAEADPYLDPRAWIERVPILKPVGSSLS